MKKIIAVMLGMLWFLLLFPLQSFAATAQASVDQPKATIGIPVILHLELTVPADADVQWPIGEASPGIRAFDFEDQQKTYWLDFGLDNSFRVDSVTSSDGQVTLTQNLQVAAFDSATMVIAPIPFVVNHTDTIYTEMVPLQVSHNFVEISDDPTQLTPLKPLLEPEFVIWDYIWWILWPLFIILMGLAAYWIATHWIHKEKQTTVVPQEKQLPPYDIAISALEALGQKKLWQDGKHKVYFTELTDILRIYIEGRFNVPAMEKTTDEILDELRELQIHQKSSYESLSDVLKLADYVKFAKYEPLPDENQMSMVKSRLFLEQTKPIVVEPAKQESL